MPEVLLTLLAEAFGAALAALAMQLVHKVIRGRASYS
jgi:hypothetical protein